MNTRSLFLIVAVLQLLWLDLLSGQDTLFAYAKSSRRPKLQPQLVTGYKLETATKVFEDLIQARGEFRMAPPSFVMNEGRQYIAWMHPGRQEIGVEEKAYDVCTKLGRDSLNALAMLIGHELVHYYEKHDWSRHFFRINDFMTASSRDELMRDGLKFEAQADHLGGVLAISAGYNPYAISGRLLELAYKEYGLPEENPPYPSLSERVQISKQTASRLRKLHSVYQMASLLTMIGAYPTANQYYKYLLKEYQSYEVYNNAGGNAALAALHYFEPAEMPYVLPFELDINSRLDQLVTRFPADREKQRARFLSDAERWFKSARELAPDEPSPVLNLALIHLLHGAYNDAVYLTNKVIEISKGKERSKTTADALVTLGIIEALKGNESEAQRLFSEASEAKTGLAERNLLLLQKPEKVAVLSKKTIFNGIEQIDGQFLGDFLENPDVDTAATEELREGVFCGKKYLASSEILLHYADDGEEFAVFHQTSEDYRGATLGEIRIGAFIGDVTNIYKTPTRRLELASGSCLIYEKERLLFVFDEEGILKKWIIYNVKI